MSTQKMICGNMIKFNMVKLKTYRNFEELKKDFDNVKAFDSTLSPNHASKNLYVFVGMSYQKSNWDAPCNVVTLANVVYVDPLDETVAMHIYNATKQPEQLVRCQTSSPKSLYMFKDCILLKAKDQNLIVGSALGKLYQVDDKWNIIRVI